MAGEKFYLNFLSDGFGKVQIDEPIGFNILSFNFQQKEDGFARDITFNGGESQMEFSSYREHYLDKIFYYNHHFGFESNVELEIVFPNGVSVIHDIDFAKAQTDDLEYFKCKMIQQSKTQIVKRREDVNVNLFSSTDIDGNPITLVPTSKILLKPKSIFKESAWEQVTFNSDGTYMEAKGTGATKFYQANPCQIITKSDIKATLSSLTSFQAIEGRSDYYILEAKEILNNTRITISGIEWHVLSGATNRGKGTLDLRFYIIYGKDFESATKQILIAPDKALWPQHSMRFDYAQTADFNIDIPLLEIGDKVWVYFDYKFQETSGLGIAATIHCRSDITGMKIKATTSSASSYSVVDGVRLIDAIKQVVKSISKLDVSAPFFDNGNDYYDTFLVNGNLLRGLKTSFPISLSDLSKSITECNSDYETGDAVFFGNEKEFYQPIECGFFDTTQFHEFDKISNPRFCINEFSFKYNKYQALKENEQPQTADTVHGEATMTLFNKNVENKKPITVEWIRDGFLIEEARNKGLQITKNTSYQDDDKIFAIDTAPRKANERYKTTSELNHSFDATTNRLTLKTDSLNFLVIGLYFGTNFWIDAPHKNAGYYLVQIVTENTVELSIANANPNINNNGIAMTGFQYDIPITNVPLVNRTIEEISNIGNITSPETCHNLRYSVKRNIETYFQSYLATCNQYWENKPITTTWYKNNKDFQCTYNDIETKEGADFIPQGQILTPFIYENVIFANVQLEEFFDLQNKLRKDRGFIRTIDKNEIVIKLFPVTMSYEVMSKELTIKGEQKFEPSQMTIDKTSFGITINNETSLVKLIYEIKEDKLFLYDSNRELLYNGVFWDAVAINGYISKTIDELDNLLKLL